MNDLRLLRFIWIPFLLLGGILAGFYTYTQNELQSGLDELNQIRSATIQASALSRIELAQRALIQKRNKLSQDTALAQTFWKARNEARTRLQLRKQLTQLKETLEIDHIDLIHHADGRPFFGKLRSHAQQLRQQYRRQKNSFTLLSHGDQLLYLSLSPIRFYGEVEAGILVLAYDLNRSLAKSIAQDTRTRAQFSLTPSSSAVQLSIAGRPLYLELEAIEDQSIRTATLTKSATALGLLLLFVLVFAYLQFKEQFKATRAALRTEGYIEAAEQVVHDVRAPLEALRNQTKSSEFHQLAPQQRQSFHAQLQRMSAILSDLIQKKEALEEKQASKEIPQLTRIDKALNDILIEKQIQYRALSHIELRSHIPKDRTALLQPNAFKRAISNLIDNAIESIEAAGCVELVLSEKEEAIVIEIHDTGKGMSDAVRKKALERGYSTKANTGHGLGLWYANTVLQRHGGTLHLQSKPQQGTTVTLVFPKTKKQPIARKASSFLALAALILPVTNHATPLWHTLTENEATLSKPVSVRPYQNELLVVLHTRSQTALNVTLYQELICTELRLFGLACRPYVGDYANAFEKKTLSTRDLLTPKIVLDIQATKRKTDYGYTVRTSMKLIETLARTSKPTHYPSLVRWSAYKTTTSLPKKEIDKHLIPLFSRQIRQFGHQFAPTLRKRQAGLKKTKPKKQTTRYTLDWHDPRSKKGKLKIGATAGTPALVNLHVGAWGSRTFPALVELSGGYYGPTQRGVRADVGWIVDNNGTLRHAIGGNVSFLNETTTTVQQETDAFLNRTKGTTTFTRHQLIPYAGPSYTVEWQGFRAKAGVGWKVGGNQEPGPERRLLFQIGYSLQLWDI